MSIIMLDGNYYAPITPLLPVYTYTGEHLLVDQGGGNWYIFFTSSGTLNISAGEVNVDYVLVGGGGGGGRGGKGYNANGGGGGGGGGAEVDNYFNQTLALNTNYILTIGLGGAPETAGSTTAAFLHSALGGNAGGYGNDYTPGGGGVGRSGAGWGGLGGTGSVRGTNGEGGGNGSHIFGNSSDLYVSAGGGGGASGYLNLAGGGGTGGNGGNYGGAGGGSDTDGSPAYPPGGGGGKPET